MGRKGLLVLGAILFSGLVLGFGSYTWISTESRLLGAAEAEGRALLRSVAAGIESSLEANRAVEGLLEDRLVRLAPILEERLAARPGREREELRAFIATHGLRGALLLDADLGVRAAAGPARPAPVRPGGPFSAGRLDRLESEALARRAREAGLADSDRVVLGFRENPLRPRTEFSLGTRAPSLGGFLLLRLDAQPLTTFRETAGVERLLSAAARAEAIDYLVILGDDGTILAADDPDRVGGTMRSARISSWRETDSGRRVLDVALPAPGHGHPSGSIHAGLAAGPIEAVQQRARLGLGVTTLLVLLIGNGALAFLARRMRKMRTREAKFRSELERRERLAALGRLAAGVAHEIRSPLNALSMASQRMRREAAPEDAARREKFDALGASVRSAIERLDGTVAEFLTLGRPATPPEREPIDLARLVPDVVAAECPSASVEAPPDSVPLRADPALLGKALANLVRNARQAAPEGTVIVSWRREGDSVRIEVRDDGPGVPVEERDAVFEPFRTGRPGGTGLGLAIARDNIVAQDGTIRVDDAPEGGACFVVTLASGGDA